MAHIKAKGRNCWAVRVFLGRGGDGKADHDKAITPDNGEIMANDAEGDDAGHVVRQGHDELVDLGAYPV